MDCAQQLHNLVAQLSVHCGRLKISIQSVTHDLQILSHLLCSALLQMFLDVIGLYVSFAQEKLQLLGDVVFLHLRVWNSCTHEQGLCGTKNFRAAREILCHLLGVVDVAHE